jgi:hypothetical protein
MLCEDVGEGDRAHQIGHKDDHPTAHHNHLRLILATDIPQKPIIASSVSVVESYMGFIGAV